MSSIGFGKKHAGTWEMHSSEPWVESCMVYCIHFFTLETTGSNDLCYPYPSFVDHEINSSQCYLPGLPLDLLQIHCLLAYPVMDLVSHVLANHDTCDINKQNILGNQRSPNLFLTSFLAPQRALPYGDAPQSNKL